MAVCSICNAYGVNRPAYIPAAESLGQNAYLIAPQPAYRSGYGSQIAPGYGLSYPAPGYGSQLLSGYGGNVGLPGYTQYLPLSSNPLLERGIYNSGAPLLLPRPGPLYSIPISAPQSASAAASASASGNRGKYPYSPASLVQAPGVIVGPAQGAAYAPAPGPIPAYRPAPAKAY